MPEVFKNASVASQTTKPAVVVGKVTLKPRTEFKAKENPHGKKMPTKQDRSAPAQKKYDTDPKVANQQVFQELQYVKKQLANEKLARAAVQNEATRLTAVVGEFRAASLELFQALQELFQAVQGLKVGAVVDGAPISPEQLFSPELLAKINAILAGTLVSGNK